MTTVKIHGYLSRIFGSSFKLHLGNMEHAIQAIDCIKLGFRKKIIELQAKGYSFSIIKNEGKLEIIPLLSGSGSHTFWMKFIAIAMVVVGVILLFTPLAPLGVSLIMSGLQMGFMLFFTPSAMGPPNNNDSATGGATLYSSNKDISYVFANPMNVTQQGELVRFGYGEFHVGSSLINTSVKNYSTDSIFEKQVSFAAGEINSLFLPQD